MKKLTYFKTSSFSNYISNFLCLNASSHWIFTKEPTNKLYFSILFSRILPCWMTEWHCIRLLLGLCCQGREIRWVSALWEWGETEQEGLVWSFVPTVREEKTNTLNKNAPSPWPIPSLLIARQSQLSASPHMQGNSVARASVEILYAPLYLFYAPSWKGVVAKQLFILFFFSSYFFSRLCTAGLGVIAPCYLFLAKYVQDIMYL